MLHLVSHTKSQTPFTGKTNIPITHNDIITQSAFPWVHDIVGGAPIIQDNTDIAQLNPIVTTKGGSAVIQDTTNIAQLSPIVTSGTVLNKGVTQSIAPIVTSKGNTAFIQNNDVITQSVNPIVTTKGTTVLNNKGGINIAPITSQNLVTSTSHLRPRRIVMRKNPNIAPITDSGHIVTSVGHSNFLTQATSGTIKRVI